MPRYLYQQPSWPSYEYDAGALLEGIASVAHQQGLLFGRLEALGFEDLQNAKLQAVTEEVLKSSEIEGEHLNLEAVRSSVAWLLGVSEGGVPSGDHYVEGVVAMAMDASENYSAPLTKERLFGWHAALFPTGRGPFGRLKVAQWRDDAEGPMQIVSRASGHEPIVHFQPPSALVIDGEIEKFLVWFEGDEEASPILKAGIAHLWFETIHPFEDGNGRIGRAILDMALARADRRPYRCYSVSAQIRRERQEYYAALEAAQRSKGDYTAWLKWFLPCLQRAISGSLETISGALSRSRFWHVHRETALTDRQRKVLLKILLAPDQRITTKKWAAIAKCPSITAFRDIDDLVSKGILIKDAAGGRSTSYHLSI